MPYLISLNTGDLEWNFMHASFMKNNNTDMHIDNECPIAQRALILNAVSRRGSTFKRIMSFHLTYIHFSTILYEPRTIFCYD